jgi:alpha-mannosidase
VIPRRASYILHVASITGHDREGADPFLVARLRLIRLLDEALDLCESDPRFQHLTLEGGAILLEDYLTLRPEHFERVEQAIQSERLLAGPWYALPDPSRVGAESLIRNLLIGQRTVRVFGPPMPVGYLPERCGLPEIMPQVFKGFGIETALAARGPENREMLEQRWQGDDGTQILLGHRLIGAPIQTLRGAAAPYSESGHVLLCYPWLSDPSRAARLDFLKTLPAAQVELRDDVFHSHPAAYARALQSYARSHDLPLLREMSPAPEPTAPPDWVRDQGTEGERLLAQVLEPLLAWGEYLESGDVETHIRRPQALIRKLWQLLLENQTPSILRGTAHNAVYDEVNRRYQQVSQAVLGLIGSLEAGADLTHSWVDRVVTVSDPGYRVTAAKLPEDSERKGLIVRGYNTTGALLLITLKPWRRFAAADVVTLDEATTGGTMGLDEAGAIRFRAAPCRLLTFWFHD